MNSQPTRILGLSETGIIWLCYLLHTCSIFCGGITSIPAIIINYIKRGDAQKGYDSALMLSHMQWQISTFWLTFWFAIAASLLTVLFFLSVLGMVLVYPLWIALLIWFVYRMLRGMLSLNNGREVGN